MGHIVDVRDVAKAHVQSLSAPTSKDDRDKRLLVSSARITWKAAAEVVREKRPDLAARLPSDSAVPPPQTNAPYDTSLAEELIGLKSYIPWEETILATIEESLRFEEASKKV